MANFPSFTFTAAGRAAITRSLSGKDVDRLIITKCVLGDGVYSGGIEILKAVTSPKMTVTVSEYTDNGDGTSVTRFVYDNASLDVGFTHREMGIYAKNGDSGAELLLCYSNAGNQYSYIKAGTIDSVTKQRKATIPPQTFKFVLATGGSGSVDAVIDPKGYVDIEMLEEHNADPAAHGDKLVNLTTNGNSLRAVKGDGTNVDVVVPYAANATNATNASYTTTQAATDKSTKIASTAFVQTAVANLVSSAPETLDTLNELANALGNDPKFATTVSTQIGQKANKTDVDSQIQKVTTELVAHNSDEHAHTAILNAHNADVNAHSVAFGTVLKKSDITVITGEVANGGTIPLPDGFLESECKWFAGIKHSNVNEWRIDVEEGSRSNLLAPICTLNGRVVTVGTQVAGLDGGSYTENGPLNFGNAWARAFIPGTAWYMCIGIHR